MAHHYKLGSFHALSPQTEYKRPPLRGPSVILIHALCTGSGKKTRGESERGFLSSVACLFETQHLNKLLETLNQAQTTAGLDTMSTCTLLAMLGLHKWLSTD